MAIVTPTDRPKSVRNRCVIEVVGGVFMLSRCFLDFSVGVGAFVIGLSQISFFFSFHVYVLLDLSSFLFIENRDTISQGKSQAYISVFDRSNQCLLSVWFQLSLIVLELNSIKSILQIGLIYFMY